MSRAYIGKGRRSVRRAGPIWYHPRRLRPFVYALAAAPIFQLVGCFPDVISAVNFELQSLINTVLVNAANIIIQNILGL